MVVRRNLVDLIFFRKLILDPYLNFERGFLLFVIMFMRLLKNDWKKDKI